MANKKGKTKLTKEEVKKIADLANIHIDESELEKYGGWISDILEYVDMLGEIDTSDADYKTHVDLKNVLRDDIVKESLSQDEATSNRKSIAKNGHFEIKSVFTPSE